MVVKDWPEGGTNWRGSSQMAQEVFCRDEATLYWVPQALQIRRSSEVHRVGVEDILWFGMFLLSSILLNRYAKSRIRGLFSGSGYF